MKDFTKIKIAYMLAGSIFWLPVIMLYLQSRGHTGDQIYGFLSLYAFMIVLLEYPTGVIGDHFSHRISMILGYLTTALALFLITIPGGLIYYIVVLFILAVGTSLRTGSDYALLSNYSIDMKKDWTNMVFLLMMWGAIASAIGGYLGSLSLLFPFYVSAIFFFIGGILILLAKERGSSENKESGNIFNTAVGAIKYVKSSPKVIFMITIGAIMVAFFTNMRWFYTPLFQDLKFDVEYWGLLTSLGLLMTFVGNRFYKKYSSGRIQPFIVLVSISLFIISFLSPVVSMLGFVTVHLLDGYLSMIFDYETNQLLEQRYRASVLSLKNLVAKLLSSLYLFLWGFIIQNYNLKIFFWINSLGFLLVGIFAVYMKNLQRKDRISVD